MRRKLLWTFIVSATLTFGLSAAELGMEAPALQIQKWVKGGPVTLAEGKGKNVYVVEFWASWCPPCRSSIPHLTEIQKKYKNKNVVVIGISGEPVNTVKPFVADMENKMDYAVAVDNNGKTNSEYMEAFGVGGIPHAFIIDKTGKIVWHGHPMDGMEYVLDQVIDGNYDYKKAAEQKRLEKELVEKGEKLFVKYNALMQENPVDIKEKKNEIINKLIQQSKGEYANEFLVSFTNFILEYDKENSELAIPLIKKAYENNGDKNRKVIYFYALVLNESGQKEKAVEMAEKLLPLAESDSERDMIKKFIKSLKESDIGKVK